MTPLPKDVLHSAKVIDGNSQAAAVGSELPLPLKVQLFGTSGNPIPGQRVGFFVASGSGQVSDSSALSDINGYATTRWTLGTTTGTQNLDLTATDPNGNTLVLTSFKALATAGPPAAVTVVSGNDQAALPLQALPSPLTVRVSDRYGNPVPGALVTFTSPDGGTAAPPSACTDSIGTATSVWTLGPHVGIQILNVVVSASVTTQTTGTALQPPQTGLLLFAGSLGGPGNQDGQGTTAGFMSPGSVAVDFFGNIFVADTGNHTIRQISPTGLVSTLAGTPGVKGKVDGPGSQALFNSPRGIAVDLLGNIFVADTSNGRVRKITLDGIVSTFATGYLPSGIDTDSAGNVYVNDCASAWAYDPTTLNHNKVRKFDPAGVELWSAPGPCTEVAPPGFSDRRWRFPSSIAVDSTGGLYTTWEGHFVTGPGFQVGTLGAPGSADGTGSQASFKYPSGIAVGPDGAAYVADRDNSTIRKVTLTSTVTTLAGTAGKSGATDGVGAEANFSVPSDTAVDSAGNVFVADTGNSTIRKITPDGAVTTWAGSTLQLGSADGADTLARFSSPNGIAADRVGNFYVADMENRTIRRITPFGVVSTYAGRAGQTGIVDGPCVDARFTYPKDLAMDSGDNLYVSDANTIRRISADGVVTTLAGMPGWFGYRDGPGAQAVFDDPQGLTLDPAGNVYIADRGNNKIRKVTPDGMVSTFAGSAGGGHIDGSLAEARFATPVGITLDPSGCFYVVENDGQTIRKISIDGFVSTIAGALWSQGSVDGIANQARFNFPTSIAIDSRGNLYIADTGNSTVRKLSPDGVVSTVVGQAGRVGFGAGVLPGVLANPRRLAIRGTNLYVTMRNGIAKVSPLP